MNEASADYYQWLIDTGGNHDELQPAYESKLALQEFDEARIERLKHLVTHNQASQPAINPSTINRALMKAGLPTTKTNYGVVRQELWVAY